MNLLSQKYWRAKQKTGFTMIEMLIIVTIVGIFATLGVVALQSSQTRSRDAERKADLEKIKVALEEYYNDNGCYPPEGTFDSCGSDAMSPYLAAIPCDPRSGEPYLYEPLAGATCSGYRMFGVLEDEDDPAIATLNCDGPEGCGVGGDYNYGISSGVTLSSGGSGGVDNPDPEGSFEGQWACDPQGICNSYADPQANNCPASFANSDCDGYCSNPVYRCGS